jgi:Predicted nucleotide-binding protein containing TIR-like domain
MTKRKPKVFVGSSSEARDTAQAFCSALKHVANMVPWWLSPEFKAMHSTLDGLIDACNRYDFGLFILTPDDKIESRGQKGFSARDNVLFEHGLFLGKLGTNRAFAVIQDVKGKRKVKVPADLLGITIPSFTQVDRHDLIASVNTAAQIIQDAIESAGIRHYRLKLTKGWGYDVKSKTFSMTLDSGLLRQNRSDLKGRALVIAVRQYNPEIDFLNDTQIDVSLPREILSFGSDEVVLKVSGKKSLAGVKRGDRVDGHLLLVPSGYKVGRAKTIKGMLEDGGELVESKGALARS